MQDKFRVFNNGTGSYDVAAPKIKALLARHRSRPIGARVTLTRQTLDVSRIYEHLTDEIGFWEVGFAPVTTAPGRDYAIADGGFDHLLGAVPRRWPHDYLEAALAEPAPRLLERARDAAGDPSGPCQGLSVRRRPRPDGRVDRRRRRALPSLRRLRRAQLGTVRDGVDLGEAAGVPRHRITSPNKTDCQTCWARPICAGGCYHEAHTRYGSTDRPNLHYCEWIRGWTHTCLEIYGEMAETQPGFLRAVR